MNDLKIIEKKLNLLLHMYNITFTGTIAFYKTYSNSKRCLESLKKTKYNY